MSEAIQEIECKRLHLSPFQPREEYPKTELEEMAQSIRAVGIVQPCVVRLRKSDGEPELVAGHRRTRAAELAGLKTVPCVVRELTDGQAALIISVENGHREGLHPLEQANLFEATLALKEVSREELAGKIGWSESKLRGVLAYSKLPVKAREGFRSGKINAAVATLIATRPGKALRERLADYAMGEINHWVENGGVKELPTVAEVKEWARQKLTVELKQAAFPMNKPIDGVTAPSCKDCPKRTGNDRENYPDSRADICTDPDCYQLKVLNFSRLELEKARAAGAMTLASEICQKIFWGGEKTSPGCGYTDMESICEYDSRAKKRTFAELLGKNLPPSTVFAAVDGRGRVHRLMADRTARKLAAEKLGIKDGTGDQAAAGNGQDHGAAEKKEAEKMRLKNRMAIADVVSAYRAAAAGKNAEQTWSDLLELLFDYVGQHVWADARKEFIKEHEPAGKNLAEKWDVLRDGFMSTSNQGRTEYLLQLIAWQEVVAKQDAGRKEVKTWFAQYEKKEEKNGKK